MEFENLGALECASFTAVVDLGLSQFTCRSFQCQCFELNSASVNKRIKQFFFIIHSSC